MKIPMKKRKNRKGSSPIGHPNETPLNISGLEKDPGKCASDFDKCAKVLGEGLSNNIGGCGSNSNAMTERTVKLYTAQGSVSKRWYVYYYLQQGTVKRRVRIYGQVNHVHEAGLRMQLLLNLQSHVKEQLSRGVAITQAGPEPFQDPVYMTCRDLLKKVLSDKKGYQKEGSHKTTRSHLDGFLKFLNKHGLSDLSPNSIKKFHINEFRNFLKSKACTNRTVNNYMVDVDAFFNYLHNNYEEHFRFNPCKGLAPWPTVSETALLCLLLL